MKTSANMTEETPLILESFAQALQILQDGYEKYTDLVVSGKWDRLKIQSLETFISQYHLPLSANKENNNNSTGVVQLRSEVEKIFVKLPALKREYDSLTQIHQTTGGNLNSGILHKRAKKFIEKYSNVSTALSNPNVPLFPQQQQQQPEKSEQQQTTTNNKQQQHTTSLSITLSNLSLDSTHLDTPFIDTPSAPLDSASASNSSLNLFSPVIRHHGLHVVLDLDETLIRYTEQPSDVINFHGFAKYREGTAYILLRSYAVEFIINLLAMDCRVYILTAGTQSYCDSVWGFLKSHLANSVSLDLLDRVVAKSCRDDQNNVLPKDFYMVGIPASEYHQSIAVDNNRMAWDKHVQDQVVVIPDWLPESMGEEDQFTFGQVKQRIEQVYNTLKPTLMASPMVSPSIFNNGFSPLTSGSSSNQQQQQQSQPHAGQILKSLYEEEEKQRMKFNARSAMRNRAPPNVI